MERDQGKVDEMVLALLYLGVFSERSGRRAWKSFDWDALDRLHEKGYICNPKIAANSVVVNGNGAKVTESYSNSILESLIPAIKFTPNRDMVSKASFAETGLQSH